MKNEPMDRRHSIFFLVVVDSFTLILTNFFLFFFYFNFSLTKNEGRSRGLTAVFCT